MASPQSQLGSLFYLSKLCVVPTTVWLRHSTTPFCCDE
jgi:hypothetical protein